MSLYRGLQPKPNFQAPTAPRYFPNLGIVLALIALPGLQLLGDFSNLKLFAYPDGQAYNFKEFPMKRQLASGWWPWRTTAVVLEH